jgi:hypothetical protein
MFDRVAWSIGFASSDFVWLVREALKSFGRFEQFEQLERCRPKSTD